MLQARILEWVAISSFGGPSRPAIKPKSPVSAALAGGFFAASATWDTPVIKRSKYIQNINEENVRDRFNDF